MFGGVGHGGFAERVAVAARNLPARAGVHELCGGIGYQHHLRHLLLRVEAARAALQPGETLLVLGAAGGVGIAAVQLGKAMGARVIAAASSEQKLAVAQDSGADELIDYSDGQLKDKVKALTGGKGADVIYDPVGGALFDQCLRLDQLVWPHPGDRLCRR